MASLEFPIRINFIYEGDAATYLDRIIPVIDGDQELSYNRSDKLSLSLGGELLWGNVSIRSAGDHAFSYDSDIMTLGYQCEFLTQQRYERLLELVGEIYNSTSPQYVFGMHGTRSDDVGAPEDYVGRVPSPITEDGLAQTRINHPTWLMLFPPAMVEEYGREWLLDLPAERIEELDDGAIMTVATDDFLDCESDPEIEGVMYEKMEPIETAFDKLD